MVWLVFCCRDLTCSFILFGPRKSKYKRKERRSISSCGAVLPILSDTLLANHVTLLRMILAGGTELFLFLLDSEAVCYAFGDERSRVWTSFAHYRDLLGTPLVNKFFQKGKSTKISVMMNNASMHCRIKKINKEGKTFILGCGFYPEASEQIVENLVAQAIEVLEEIGTQNGFSEISNPFGHLVHGDSCVFVIGEDGMVYAQSDNIAQMGKNIFNPPLDPPGSLAYQDKAAYRHVLVSFLRSNEQRAWLPPIMVNNTTKRIFVAKYRDPKTRKRFIVGSFYYPELNDEAIYELVQKAITYLKAQGRRAAFETFNTPEGPLALGSGRIIVLNFDGACLVDATPANLAGSYLIDRADVQGHYPYRRILEGIQRYGRSWISQYLKNAYQLMYAEKVDLPDGSLIIAAGYWPDSKALTVRSMVDRAANFLERNGESAALRKFTTHDSDFVRGDVNIMALDPTGIILSDGPFRKYRIWSDVALRDRFGRHVINKILETAAQGGGWVGYRKFNADYRAYTRQIDIPGSTNTKDNSMVLVAGYYL